MISGLLISAIMGLIPAITTNFTVIMVSRLGLGLGVGLFSPHAISLLTHSFTDDLRARLLGYQTGLSALGNAILLGLAGLLISLSWHAVFWLYGLLVIVAGAWRGSYRNPLFHQQRLITHALKRHNYHGTSGRY